VHAHARNLRLANGAFVPFETELEADYSPENIFFRQFHFWNQHADLSAFVGAAKNYFQVQDLRFALNGHPRLTGNVFLPISAAKFRENPSWLAALSPDPFFDVDLRADALDLAEFAGGVKTKPDLSGQANGQLQLSGTPGSLQGKSEIHLRDFILDNSPAMSGDVDARLAFGMANLTANVAARGSEPVKLQAAVPIQLEKHDSEFSLASNGPFSATLNFPALFLARLPGFISRGFFTRGILSGNLNLSDSIQHPTIMGSVDLTDGQLLRGLAISAGMTFTGAEGTINFLHWKEREADVSARGKIEFSGLTKINLVLWPNVELTPMMALKEDDCVGAVALSASPLVARLNGFVNQIDLSGKLSGSGWEISMSQEPPNPDNNPDYIAAQTFPLCRDGKLLSLGLVPTLIP